MTGEVPEVNTSRVPGVGDGRHTVRGLRGVQGTPGYLHSPHLCLFIKRVFLFSKKRSPDK